MVPENGQLKQAATEIVLAVLTGQSDLRHPSRPDAPLLLPGFNPVGHNNPDYIDAIQKTAQMLAEAIVDMPLAKLGAELIATAELEQLHAQAANAPSQIITIECRHGELMRIAAIPGTDTARIDCERLRANLTECEDPRPT